MEISLYFIPFQTTINATGILLIRSLHLRSLWKLFLPTPFDLSKDMGNMLVLFLGHQPLCILLVQRLVLLQSISCPRIPACGILGQQLSCKDIVSRGIAHDKVQVIAGHLYHHIHVELHLLRHALFHAKVVVFLALIPFAEFGQREERAKDKG